MTEKAGRLMGYRLTGRHSLLFLAFTVMLAFATLVAGFSLKAEALVAGSNTPTISSDLVDYPPGATVTLTGSNWQPGESVHIFVNDEEGRTWSRDVNSTADDSGQVQDQFQLPDWFVATYKVTATGAQSGVATTTFTDAQFRATGGGLTGGEKWKLTWSRYQSSGTCAGTPTEGPKEEILGVGSFSNNIQANNSNQSVKLHASATLVDNTGTKVFQNWTGPNGFTSTNQEICRLGIGGGDTVTYTANYIANRAPVANNDSYSVNEDGTLTVPDGSTDVLSNDSDPDGDSLSASANTQPSNGTLNLSANGSFTYTPNANFSGSDSFTYTVSDGKGGTATGTVNITVNPVNDTPSFTKGANQTVNEDSGSQTINGWASAISAGPNEGSQNVNFVISSNSNPSLFSSGPSVSSGGNLSYTPASNENGTATIGVKIKDDGGTPADPSDDLLSAEQTFTITVRPVNDAPDARDDSAETNEDTAISAIPVLSNDTDIDSANLTAIKVTGAAHGTVTLNPDNKTFNYTPEANYNGPDEFTYRANDGTADSNVATVRITIKEANDPPIALPDSITVGEDGEKSFDATSNDQKGPANESTQTLSVDSIVAQANHGTATKNPDGTIKYVPDADYNGPDSFTYKVCDDGTTNGSSDPKCAIGTVSVNVTPVNDAPVADNDAYPVDEDQTLNIAAPGVLENDSDIDSANLTAVLVNGPAHGQLTLDADGSFSYTPDADYNGTDSFTYKAKDEELGSDTATVTLDVRPVNDKPVANNDSYNVDEDTATNLPVLSNDTDADRDSLTASVVSGPSHGTLTPNGNGFSYTPSNNFSGLDSFTYKANDGAEDSNVATVGITVREVNDNPVISSVTASGTPVDEGSPATIRVTATDPDTPAADLRYSFDCNGDGDYADTGDKGPQAADSASCTFDDGAQIYKVNVRVTDGAGGAATDSTNVGVRNVAPTITDISASPQLALLNQNVNFTGTATDPSVADTNAGFTWKWSKDGVVQTGMTTKVLQTSFNTCGQHTVSATATDKDGGVSAEVTKANVVNVLEANFRPPIDGPATNLTLKGKVIPVKIYAGCNTIVQPGLTPNIKLLNGDVRAGQEGAGDVVEAYSVSAADSTGWMRPVDGGYIYNLQVPGSATVAVGQEFTIRVHPLATSANPTAGPAMYAVLKIKK